VCVRGVNCRTGVASVDYGELMKQSFSFGPSLSQRFANASRYVQYVVLVMGCLNFAAVVTLQTQHEAT